MTEDKTYIQETLLDMSKRQYRTARILYQSYPSDDGVINDVAYHLQQCVELCIKHVLEWSGVSYPKQHNIRELLNLVPDYNMFPFYDVCDIADKITSLEADTRYIKGYRASLDIVRQVFSISDTMLKNADGVKDLYPTQRKQELREDIIWENRFSPDTPEYIFCRNYNKEYKRLGAPTSKEGYDKATQFATKALYFANVPKEKIMSVINELAPMVPYQDEDKPYMLDIVNAVENMPDIKEFMKNQSENKNSIKSR